jgi:hypothetical protein
MKLKLVSVSLLISLFLTLSGCGSSNQSGSAPDLSTQIQGVANDAIISVGVFYNFLPL